MTERSTPPLFSPMATAATMAPASTSPLTPLFRPVLERPPALLDTQQLREVERRALGLRGEPVEPDAQPLMAAAGAAAAALILAAVPAPAPRALRVWCFAGPGNNGGDALCTATTLRAHGVDVRVCMPMAPADTAGGAGARWAQRRAHAAGVPIQNTLPDDALWRSADWIVDGLFGIGLNRPLTGIFATIAQALADHTAGGAQVLALDIPSGLNADTGALVAPDRREEGAPPPAAVEATHTLCFLAPTPGLFTGRGPDLTGGVFVATLGVPGSLLHDVLPSSPLSANASTDAPSHPSPDSTAPPSSADADADADADTETPRRSGIVLNTPDDFMPSFSRRRPSSHKGTFGSLAIVGGDTGTCGAVILSARAALYLGAGRVHAALIGRDGPTYDPPHPEIMIRDIETMALETMNACTIGPGLGKSDRAAAIVRRVVSLGEHGISTIIDADALNLVSIHHDMAQLVRRFGEHLVITPHPAEAARLLEVGTRDIEADRIAAARQLCARYRCTVILKGAGTIAASPDGRMSINTTGNTGLSTGGTGDVLSGVVGALLAQRLPPFDAARAAMYVHGEAAQRLSASGSGPAGLTAGELAPAMRACLNDLLARYGKIVTPGTV